ncbi:MAG: hypothetical protein RSE07_01720 [Oscillospiraceae bacterium]
MKKTKIRIAVLFIFTFVISLNLFAAEGDGEMPTQSIDAFVKKDSGTVYSVEVYWGNMNFSYSDGKWDAENLTQSGTDSKWNIANNEGLTWGRGDKIVSTFNKDGPTADCLPKGNGIAVANRSNAQVNATFNFSPSAEFDGIISGKFTSLLLKNNCIKMKEAGVTDGIGTYLYYYNAFVPSGNLDGINFTNEELKKMGTISITFAPYTG